MIWGSNPAESSPPSWERLKDCQAQGAKLIVIDPRVTKTAARADLHLPCGPRTDGALALGLIHVMIAEDLYDREFVENWCLGFDEVRRRRRRSGRPSARARSPASTADLIVAAARMYATEHARAGSPSASRRPSSARAPPARRCSAARSCARSRATSTCPGGEPLGNPYDESQYAWLENVGFDRLIDHPLRTRESVNAAETPDLLDHGLQGVPRGDGGGVPEGPHGLRVHALREPARDLRRHRSTRTRTRSGP